MMDVCKSHGDSSRFHCHPQSQTLRSSQLNILQYVYKSRSITRAVSEVGCLFSLTSGHDASFSGRRAVLFRLLCKHTIQHNYMTPAILRLIFPAGARRDCHRAGKLSLVILREANEQGSNRLPCLRLLARLKTLDVSPERIHGATWPSGRLPP